MAGYSFDYSKSNNALIAEGDGKLPLSRAARATKIPAELIGRFVDRCEWHHSSKFYNRVDYYDLAEIEETFGRADSDLANPEAVAALAAWKPAPKTLGERHEGCIAEWLEWSGSRNRPRAEQRRADGIAVTVKGSFATLHLPGGDLRKKLGARGFVIRLADGRRL